MKVFIAVPCGELSRYSAFWQSFQHLAMPEGVTTVLPPFAQGVYIGTAQNMLAREFMKTDADYFWLVNDDQPYHPATLARLLSHHVDVVGPLCMAHDLTGLPLVYDEVEGGLKQHYLKKHEHGLLSCGAIGGGGMLVSRKVLDTIPDPWWETSMRYFEPSTGKPPLQSTEDIEFCAKARQAGFYIWCDLDCPVGHMTIDQYWPGRNQDGEWSMVIVRGEHQVVVPVAKDPEASKLILPDFQLAAK